MTREGQGTSEQAPRPPASTRWNEPGSAEAAVGPLPPFVPSRRPATGRPTAPPQPEAESPTVETSPPERTPVSDADEPAEVSGTGAVVEGSDQLATDTGEAATDTADVARDTTDVARDTADVVEHEEDLGPIPEYDISGPFEPLPRDQGGWIPDEETESLTYDAGAELEEAVEEEDVERGVEDRPPMVPVSELPPPHGAGHTESPLADRDEDLEDGYGQSEPIDGATYPPASPEDEAEPAVAEIEDESERPGVTAAVAFDEGAPDLASELADRLEALAERLRDDGAEGARSEMESFDRFTALVAGLVSGFLAGHGR